MAESKPKKKNALLPVMGLLLAVTLGVVSYMVAPSLLSFGEDQNAKLKSQIDDFRTDPKFDNLPEKTPEYVLAAAMWMILMGLSMFLVSAAIGADPTKETWDQMGAHPADKKAMVKQLKRDLKEAEKRAKQKKKMKK